MTLRRVTSIADGGPLPEHVVDHSFLLGLVQAGATSPHLLARIGNADLLEPAR